MFKRCLSRSRITYNIYKKYVKKVLYKSGVLTDGFKGNGITISQSLLHLREIKNANVGKKIILVSGHICFSSRIPFMYRLGQLMPDTLILIMVENGETTYDSIYKYRRYQDLKPSQLKSIVFDIVPELFIKDRYPRYKKSNPDEYDCNILKEKDYVNEARLYFRQRHYDMGKLYPEMVCCKAYEYLSGVLSILKPDLVLLWNEFHPFHKIFAGLCKDVGVNVNYFEFGSIPGTYAIDKQGQMGESYPCQNNTRFNMQYVTGNELKRARLLIEEIMTKGVNRKIQPQRKNLLNLIRYKGQPVIFFVGQNDYESGMVPYTPHSKKYHSPLFSSSYDALLYLSKLAKNNKWNLIYKPHPLVVDLELKKKIPRNVIYVDDVNFDQIIDMSNLVITILSQGAYQALFRGKPVLLMGHMQLEGKGCVYEAHGIDDIEDIIKLALKDGYSDNQKYFFDKHIAQMEKYYLFNDMTGLNAAGMDLCACAFFLREQF